MAMNLVVSCVLDHLLGDVKIMHSHPEKGRNQCEPSVKIAPTATTLAGQRPKTSKNMFELCHIPRGPPVKVWHYMVRLAVWGVPGLS